MIFTQLLVLGIFLNLSVFLPCMQANVQPNQNQNVWKSLDHLNSLILSTPHIEEVCGSFSYTVGLKTAQMNETQPAKFVQSHYAPSELNINIFDIICQISAGLPTSVDPITNSGSNLLLNAEYTCTGLSTEGSGVTPKIDVLLLVSSKPHRRTRREVIRRYWANATCWLGANVRHVFLIDSASNINVSMTALYREQLVNHDIIQQDSEYVSDNVTSQLLLGFKWATAFCSTAKWLIFVEDNYFVNPFNVISLLRSISQAMSHRLVIGQVWHLLSKNFGSIVGPRKSAERPANITKSFYYIPFVATSAMIVSGSLVPSLYLTMRFTLTRDNPDFYFADVLRKLFLQPAYNKNIYSYKRNPVTKWGKLNALIFPVLSTQTEEEIIRYWSIWKRQQWCLV